MNNIYYFTGTGNSLQIAQDLAEKIGDCVINKIADYKGEKIDDEVLCIIYPVYNWGIPSIIDDFLNKLNVKSDTKIYAVADYGGFPGLALEMTEDILTKRGLKLSGGFLVRMPGNYILAYGAFSEKSQQKIFQKESTKIEYIAECIRYKKKMRIEKKHTLLSKMFTNYFYKEMPEIHDKDRNFTVSGECMNCGLCAKRCPVNNITLENGKPEWNHKCELCLSCIQSCPKQAIDYNGKAQGRKRYLNPNVSL